MALYCRAITMSPAIKHHLSGPQIRMGQGYMPKVHLSGLHGIKVILSVTISYKYLCTLRTSDFPFAAKKTTTYSLSHQCKLHNSKCSDQHLHTYWRLWGHILLFNGAQYGYSQTSDFQQALKKVIICPDRYLQSNITTCAVSLQLT